MLSDKMNRPASHASASVRPRSHNSRSHSVNINLEASSIALYSIILCNMATSSPPSLTPDNEAAPSTFWGFLGAPMAGNASFFAGFLYFLAIAFKWFLRLLLVVLVVGIILGTGALIFGSLPFHNTRCGGKSKPSTDRDGSPDTEIVELDVLAAEFDSELDLISDSGEEY